MNEKSMIDMNDDLIIWMLAKIIISNYKFDYCAKLLFVNKIESLSNWKDEKIIEYKYFNLMIVRLLFSILSDC